ncbi:hypothetical protein [Streptomyces sp. NPDC093223]|uniref:hypothetical protein n=1 Tax=Streptomyces sp. NPDC093223 TaxID=3366033 RepID=UPI003827C56B
MMETPMVNPIVGAVPGGGWAAEFLLPDGTVQQWALLAWLVRADGTMQPVNLDGQGWAEDPRDAGNFVRLVPPEDRG